MKTKKLISAEEASRIQTALNQGDADEAFCVLADFLKANELQLSDQTLRVYIRRELFKCFSGRSALFDGFLSPLKH